MAIPGHAQINVIPDYAEHTGDIHHGWTDNEVPVQASCTGCGKRSAGSVIYTWRNNIEGTHSASVLEPGGWMEVRTLQYGDGEGRAFFFCPDCYDDSEKYIDAN